MCQPLKFKIRVACSLRKRAQQALVAAALAPAALRPQHGRDSGRLASGENLNLPVGFSVPRPEKRAEPLASRGDLS